MIEAATVDDGEVSPPTQTNNADLGLILGLSIPLLLILLSLILIVKVRSSKDDEEDNDENIHDDMKES